MLIQKTTFKPLYSKKILLVGAGLAVSSIVFSCKHTSKDQSATILKQNTVHRDQRGYDDQFTHLVNSGRLKDALNFACIKFNLKCEHISISQSSDGRNRAVTYPYTNKIVLYPAAFEYLGMPHPGWLASIIEHENLHTKQSMYIRAVVMGPQARILGDRSYEAAIEYEAWQSMLDTQNKFELTCEMTLEIQRQLFFYGKILNSKGRGPKDELDEVDNYTMPNNEQKVLMNRCLSQKSP